MYLLRSSLAWFYEQTFRWGRAAIFRITARGLPVQDNSASTATGVDQQPAIFAFASFERRRAFNLFECGNMPSLHLAMSAVGYVAVEINPGRGAGCSAHWKASVSAGAGPLLGSLHKSDIIVRLARTLKEHSSVRELCA